jgi:predicted PurR-regulated permease PerM
MTTKWNTSTRIAVLVLILILLILLAYEVRSLITPLIIAGLVAYTLNLAVRFISNRTKIGRKWIVNAVYFIFIAILIAAPGTLVPVAVRQINTLSNQLEEAGRQLEILMSNPVNLAGITFPIDQLWQDLTSMTTDFGSAFGGALAVLETTSVNLLRLLIIVVVSYYLLMDWQGLREWLINIIPESGREDARRLLVEVDQIWRAYMQGTLALMLIMGILFIIIGLAIGLPGAVAIGLLTGFLSMIPEIGPWISGIIAVAIAYFAGSNHLPISNFWFAVVVAGIYLVVTQVKSIWLRPQVMGRYMRMNTGVVFLAILAAAMLQGILAALVILPFLATAGVLGRYARARLLNLEPWPAPIAPDQVEDSSLVINKAAGEKEEEAKRLQSI